MEQSVCFTYSVSLAEDFDECVKYLKQLGYANISMEGTGTCTYIDYADKVEFMHRESAPEGKYACNPLI